MPQVKAKICGIKSEEALKAAADFGASYIGFVFATTSPRLISPQQASLLANLVPAGIKRVGLFVDPDDTTLQNICGIVQLDMIQLHGQETPDRVAAIHERLKRPIIKAIPIATQADFAQVPAYETVADILLFDTKASGEQSGGTGQSFDWNLLKGKTFAKPWILAGGLTPANVAQAIAATGARTVDVSSGVEQNKEKSPGLIRDFLYACSGETKP